MISGVVNADREAVLRVTVVAPDGRRHRVDAVVDTGFSGDLTLPAPVIAAFGLSWLGREQGILADGTTEMFEVYSATIEWDGRRRSIEVEAVNAQPLVGMNLLHRHSLRMDVIDGGAVEVRALP
ncbi:MAG: clan AA aspartic protease [Planctomycetia bacterium]|nr:clan AA aspartic protease [Planctomycetia bacterium]